MITIRIVSVGKTKERWLEEAILEYEKRLTGRVRIEWAVAKDDKHLLRLLKEEQNLILCDVRGAPLSSEQFANTLQEKGARFTFVIGGADGLPKELQSDTRVSLSSLTLTHQMVRLLLVEQIYRGYQILNGRPYHR